MGNLIDKHGVKWLSVFKKQLKNLISRIEEDYLKMAQSTP